MSAPVVVDRATVIDLRAVRALGVGALVVGAAAPEIGVHLVPGCPLRAVSGVPCPLCGMARGIRAVVHGDLAAAVTLNPGSLVVTAAAVYLLVRWRRQRVRVPKWVVGLTAALLAAMWGWQLFKYATGREL